MRVPNGDYFDDLNSQGGFLAPLKQRIKSDGTLMLALRDHSVNIYYRGGNLLQLTQIGQEKYEAYFNRDYEKGPGCPWARLQDITKDLPKYIETPEQLDRWINAFPGLKECINFYLQPGEGKAGKEKTEREFQQLVVWENNRSKLAPATDYFITDIEYDVLVDGVQMRLDMLGLKWPTGLRSGPGVCSPVIIEKKYGIDSFLASSSNEKKGSGIKEHFDDICKFFGVEETDPVKKKMAEERKARLRKTIGDQFRKLWKLGLVRFNPSKAFLESEGPPMVSGTPEFIFLLANNNPRSTKLASAINSISEDKIIKAAEHFKLRFFAASFAGYGMHDACMMELADLKKHLKLYS